MRSRAAVVIAREPHSNFCGKCRQWIVSEEAVDVFSEVDGAPRKVRVWFCPACRGDAPAGEAEVARGPVTAADLSRDERLGPHRDVDLAVPRTASASGKSERVTLRVCGHTACVAAGASGVRCLKCRAKRGAAS